MSPAFRSIRHELLVRLLGGVLVLQLIAGAFTGTMMRDRMRTEFDAALLAKARALASLTSREGRGIELDFSSEHMPEFEREEDRAYLEVRLRGGPLITRSPEFDTSAMPAAGTSVEAPVFSDWDLPDGRIGRIVRLAFIPRFDPDEDLGDEEDEEAGELFTIPESIPSREAVVVLTIARGRGPLDMILWSIYATLAGVTVVLLAAIAFWVRSVTARALRPIGEIDAQLAAIGPDALQQRVGLRDPPRELHTIIAAMNNLLTRLQRGFERERRFSSDVAHELRTPVAELRTACEVGAQWPDDPSLVRQFFDDMREIAVQMETTVNNLLMLAGCESGQISVSAETVPLEALVRGCWSHAAAEAERRGVRCEFHLGENARVRTDRHKLELVVQNLLSNAAAYAALGSVIQVFARNGGARIELAIENRVEDLAADDLPHLFDRFWRKDPARTAGSHAGLGLSIAKALCDLLAVEFQIDVRDAEIFSARLTFASAV